MSNKTEQVNELVALFRESGNQDNAFDNLAAQRLGINRTDLDAVNIVEAGGGMTAGELAAEAGLTTGAVTGVIDRLERAGYLRRVADPGDRRKVLVEVTPAFYAAARRIWGPMMADWQKTMSRRFTAAELESFAEFLRETTAIGRRHADRIRGN